MNFKGEVPRWGKKPAAQNRLIRISAILLLLSLMGVSVSADGTWVIETVDSVGLVGSYSSLALDSGGLPHICYYKGSPSNYLKHAYYDGSSWNTEVADINYDVGQYASLAIAGNDRPYVSYFDVGNADLKCRYRTSIWMVGWRVDEYGWVGMNSSIALDSQDHIHISYEAQMPSGHNYIRYAYYDGSSWSFDDIEELVIGGTSIAVDSDDHPRVVYNDYENFVFKYALYNGSSWQIDTIIAQGVGSVFSMALDSYDNVHVSFYRNTDLYYAYYDGSWQITMVDSAGQSGAYNSIAVDSHDRPHIAYYDIAPANEDLKYAYYDGASWHLEVVDTTGDVGKYASIDLDNLDIPHIGYFDYTNRDLKYAVKYIESIPSLSDWGLLILALLLLAAGTVAVVRRGRKAIVKSC